jgi:hypothetical protein
MKNHDSIPRIIDFESIGSADIGYISIAEGGSLPFDVKRVYWTYYTPQNLERGNHAHKNLQQILVAVSGVVDLKIETASGEMYHFVLDSPTRGVYLPSMSWRTMKYSHNAVQMCLASMKYEETDYIRDYKEFKTYKRNSL